MPPTFRPRNAPSRKEQGQAYDGRRGSARARGYDARWDKEAEQYRLSHPLCLGCEAVGRITATEVVDHTIPHKGDQALFWKPDNRQPACRPHHDIVKQRLETLYAQGKASADDLRLDSTKAKQLTIDLLP